MKRLIYGGKRPTLFHPAISDEYAVTTQSSHCIIFAVEVRRNWINHESPNDSIAFYKTLCNEPGKVRTERQF